MKSPAPDQSAAELKAMQDSIYREKILRARRQTPDELFADVFELSDHQFGMMLAGAMHRRQTVDEEIGWEEVKRWMKRLDLSREYQLYTTDKPGR
jgi:hypothetical protein